MKFKITPTTLKGLAHSAWAQSGSNWVWLFRKSVNDG
jgi:ABC-type phosphate transport system auxiliary subunit